MVDLDYIRLNVAFKPPEEVIEKAINLSQEVSKNKEVFFILDGIQFHPHITIYSPKFPKSNLNKVLEIVEEIAKNTSRVEFQVKNIRVYKRFISVNFNYSLDVKSLHEEIVAKLNPLREGCIRKEYEEGSDYHMKFSSEQKENIKKYGYPESMNLYKPHLTIIRLKEESLAGEVVKSIKWDIPQFIVDKIAVYEMGEHGTCRALVKEFNLK
ncbi:MAG: 2'-5' RNA ligase family protein [Candidatus Woesearchaeota archaeon]|nr:MAG: 2'-5' RNA ligase family protein [Candidatus Woesearchaeota archaeon]